MRQSIAVVSLAIAGAVYADRLVDFKERCASFADDPIFGRHHLEVTTAEYVSLGSTIDHAAEGLNETCAMFAAPPFPSNLCRLVLDAATSNSSSVHMEVWLPEKWSGRFATTGNGGFGGCIQYGDMAYAASYGFATVGTDNGHSGMSGGAFFRQPEVLKDFAWRAIYTGATLGRKLADAFYEEKCGNSYYFGCSTGGRQAFKAVQSFPELFDGVVSGAPALLFPNMWGWGGYISQLLAEEPTISNEQWVALQAEVMSQCDNLDGATDGVIEDTRKCNPDLGPLLCENQNGTTCFTRSQLSVVDQIYSAYSVNGTLLYPGAEHGYEPEMLAVITTEDYKNWVREWYRFVVYDIVSWDIPDFVPADAVNAIAQNPYNIKTYDADLSAFRDLGGKVIHWHGQNDEIIPVGSSDQYYDLVQKTMNATTEHLDEFYRYFRASGTGHCYFGTGAWMLGQTYGFAAGDDPEDNLLMSIVDWVENGNAPEFIRGAATNDRTDPTSGVKFHRRHCKYPKANTYRGTQDGVDEEGWSCVDDK